MKAPSGNTGVDVCETDGHHHFLHSVFPRDLGVSCVFGEYVL